MERASRLLHVRARGPWACFTRPDMKVERVSYEIMTPSAARGVLEAVLWKPAIRWQVHVISVLAPIAWASVRRNELKSRASPRVGHVFIEDDHAQRNSVVLRDVDYVISASFSLTERAGPEDNVRKFEEMFVRRLEKGQHAHAPYLGCREFAADLSPAPERFAPIDPGVDRPLGMVFYDFDYRKPEAIKPYFFEARLRGGVLDVPPPEAVFKEASP
jgi:CRISPR-associated protein Cas5d